MLWATPGLGKVPKNITPIDRLPKEAFNWFLLGGQPKLHCSSATLPCLAFGKLRFMMNHLTSASRLQVYQMCFLSKATPQPGEHVIAVLGRMHKCNYLVISVYTVSRARVKLISIKNAARKNQQGFASARLGCFQSRWFELSCLQTMRKGYFCCIANSFSGQCFPKFEC